MGSERKLAFSKYGHFVVCKVLEECTAATYQQSARDEAVRRLWGGGGREGIAIMVRDRWAGRVIQSVILHSYFKGT